MFVKYETWRLDSAAKIQKFSLDMEVLFRAGSIESAFLRNRLRPFSDAAENPNVSDEKEDKESSSPTTPLTERLTQLLSLTLIRICSSGRCTKKMTEALFEFA